MTNPTPLLDVIRKLIATSGPMPVSRYMQICLTHPEHGYYVGRDPLGRDGDFTTAPEVSQMFGELIGLWTAAVWREMGAPPNVNLIELGPGRGTMMADALRAVRVVPPLFQAITVHLVEINAKLRDRQRSTLSGRSVTWYDSLADVPRGPSIILANEYFDVLPVHQMVKSARGWHERMVALSADGNLYFDIAHEPTPRFEVLLPPPVRRSPIGAVFEWRSDHEAMQIASRVRTDGGAALVIDYGYLATAAGDTLQAIERHAYADPLENPGRADVTAHVDFQALARAAEDVGARIHGPAQQNEFLQRLGIEARAATLSAKATPQIAEDIVAAMRRLIGKSPEGMGELFKVIAISDPGLKSLVGFSDERQAFDGMRVATSALLDAAPGVRHAFFGRDGGVSKGIYAGLNGGVGSNDDPADVTENRRRMAEALGVAPSHFLTVHQVHSPDVVIATEPWRVDQRPRADALVTRTTGLALGATAADCGPVLFADPSAKVIGAAHAGWKGALTGVIEATVDAMASLGAERPRIIAAIGPLIRQPSYEVGAEFIARFTDADPGHARFFIPSAKDGHAMFDLGGFIRARLEAARIGLIDDTGIDTYPDENYFSYRRTTHRGEPDYGRHVHAIVLED